MKAEYWKKRSEFMEDLIYGCGGDIADRCGEYITFNPEPSEAMCEANSNAVLGEVLHDIGVWGIENKIPVTKTDKLKAIMVKHFT